MGPALEDNFLVAYLDQRGCGKSLATSDSLRLNVEQYVEDLDIVTRTNSSGENEKVGNITSRSNQQLRSMLIESAWIAIRQDPALMMS